MNEQFKKRLYSFLWRLGGMVFAAALQFLTDNYMSLPLPNEITVMLGLVIGELTKHMNTRKS